MKQENNHIGLTKITSNESNACDMVDVLNQYQFHESQNKPEPMMKKNNNSHIISIPLLNSEQNLIGFIGIQKELESSEEDIHIAKSLSIGLVTAIENCWRVDLEKEKTAMEKELEIAKVVQEALISHDTIENSTYTLHQFYQSASQCGGDWFWYKTFSSNRVLVLFGDVTGHGIPAALMTGVVRGAAEAMYRQLSNDSLSPDSLIDLLHGLNQALLPAGNGTYLMTMAAALIDMSQSSLHLAWAGHTPPLLVNSEGKVSTFVPPLGHRLGFTENPQFELCELPFPKGSAFLLYTDGIVEGNNPQNREYGIKNLKKSLQKVSQSPGNEVLQHLIDEAYVFFDGIPPHDDIALIYVKHMSA